jgi:hypothetical protein
MTVPLSRPTPFDLAFAELAPDRFPAIRDALDRDRVDPADRDAFLLNREVVTLVRELRPDEGAGEEIGQLAALVHQVYLFWTHGQRVLHFDPSDTERLLSPAAAAQVSPTPTPFYGQVAERRVWAEPMPGAPHEPLDGCFVHAIPGTPAFRVLGVFGLHPDRPGFTVVEAEGPRSEGLARSDGSALYASLLTGGAAAGLYSLAGAEELLELGFRMTQRADALTNRES